MPTVTKYDLDKIESERWLSDEPLFAPTQPKTLRTIEAMQIEVKPKMKKKKIIEILAEYHHQDIVALREEIAALKARLAKTEQGQDVQAIEGHHPEVFARAI